MVYVRMEWHIWVLIGLQASALAALSVLAYFVRARFNRIEHAARREARLAGLMAQESLDAVALGALRFDFPVFFGGPAIRASLARELVWQLVATRPRTIVELGSGSSTILLAKVLQSLRIEGVRHVVIDHDARFLEITRANAQLNSVEGRIDFNLCPLGPVPSQSKPWYQGVEDLCRAVAPIDLLLVDGPPAFTPQDAGSRAAALPTCHQFLSRQALVIVDDADRSGEREMVRRWLSSFPDLERAGSGSQVGVDVLRRRAGE